MKNCKMKDRILSAFSSSPVIALSYNELNNTLQLTKKEKAELGETLNNLVADGTLTKEKRKYRLSEAAKPQLSPTSLSSSLIQGFFDATPMSRNLSFAFVRTEDKDYYIDAEDTYNAYHNDLVAFEPKYRRGKKAYGIIRRIVKRANETLAGDLVKMGKKWMFICSNPKIHNWFEVSETGGGTEGYKVMLQVTNWGNPVLGTSPAGIVTEVLGLSGDPNIELLAVIRQYNLPLEFPEEVLHSVDIIAEEINPQEYKNRRDLRELFTFTIDPVSAKDFDDAISLENTEQGWRLFVHIADVAHYVPLGSVVFEEAAKRGNSFYFPKKVIPMLPEKISNKICSLRPTEDKLCMTVESQFNRKGGIISQSIYESIICSDVRLAYEEVDALFGSDMKDKKDFPDILCTTLVEARKLSRLLTERRMAAGYIFFDLPEVEYQYDNEGFIHRLNLAEETESHKLIENFMLIANEYVAERLSIKAPTTLYRIHEDPDYSKLEKVLDTLSYYGVGWVMHENLNKSVQYLLASFPNPVYHQVFDRILLRSMKKAKYSTEHISHFGLALKNYTHFTSPIRRLCDLVIHHLCKISLLGSSLQKITTTQVKHYAQVASEQEIQADHAERDIEQVYSRAYMREKIGESYTGMVIACNTKGLIIRLKEIPITGVFPRSEFGKGTWDFNDRAMRYTNRYIGSFFQLMDTLKVKVASVEDDVYLCLMDEKTTIDHVYLPKSSEKPGTRKMDVPVEKKGIKAVDYRGGQKKHDHRNAKTGKKNKGKR